MIKLLIDTCVWFDIAQKVQGEKIIPLLEEFINSGEISLIVPEIIVDEFNKNNERIRTSAGKSLSSYFDKVKEIITLHSDSTNKELILSHLNDISYKIPSLGESVFISLQKIKELFAKSEIIKTSDEIKLRAIQRAIDKKAPFHKSKNSVGDAIIIESYNDYRIKNDSQEFKMYFITHNKNDFSIENGNQKTPHEDLSEIFDSVKSYYFINLLEALNEINSELVKDFDDEKDWYNEPRNLTEMLIAQNELEQKIWYNRHQNLLFKIRTDKIKIINRKEFNINTLNETIIDEIWEGAKESAKLVEKKYGKKNLIWDDFEWGMLNGKLSAIRWIKGEEWDNLDT